MKKKLSSNSGFTLFELLIVVAILAILVAISIPVFTSALEPSRDSTDAYNERAAKTEASYVYNGITKAVKDNGDSFTGVGADVAPTSGWFVYDANNGVLRVLSKTDGLSVGIITNGNGWGGWTSLTTKDAYGKCTGKSCSDDYVKLYQANEEMNHTDCVLFVYINSSDGKISLGWHGVNAPSE